MPVKYQNQTTAFILGGNNVRINGHGSGTFDGNANKSNYPGRPHALTLNGSTNSVIKRISFIRSKMWTLSVIYSHKVELDSIFVNNTGNRAQSCELHWQSFRSSHIKFNNWTVYNGDDRVSLKADSTDISITNCEFYNGLGIAIGSIGKYTDQFETIERLTVENISYHTTRPCTRSTLRLGRTTRTVTRQTEEVVVLGANASNMTFQNLTSDNIHGGALTISQCTRFSGAPGEGNASRAHVMFQIIDIKINGLEGITQSSNVASLQCSAVAPCIDIGVYDVDLRFANGTEATGYLCGNFNDVEDFECTEEPRIGGSAIGVEHCSSFDYCCPKIAWYAC
ncbi:pectin lyase fold/virulence factor [Pseudomassariella vexata]|uniref:Pectin lyase fold/virulence factor n=1 Tax=Pseudomassariella vexata TaxID=1141098 RepID=A0A1Y2DJC3_9PEZI|nr:pectin lyase fold/virulence factor [Pseudomassariella vexata]ORY59312.1 pectin lyase fold/virulence factor [Pseudomassariella vexata]